MRTLAAYIDDQHIGTLGEGNDLWRFEYDDAWRSSDDGFDLSPALSRSKRLHEDGGSDRPVQWYFDNLLPEEEMRVVVSKQAAIKGDDAFALLGYLGAESAGSLVLLPPGTPLPARGSLEPLPDAQLCARIKDIPRKALGAAAPKRMSLAGAQEKLLVVYRNGELFEPVGSEPSTHILKPNHQSDDYAASVINEYVTMTLAGELGLAVPPVHRRYTPEPVYIIERFDRYGDAGGTKRRQIIDACQLLNKSRLWKYHGAGLETLNGIVERCGNRAATRQRLYIWLVFNLLVANNDNHLKNLSFTVGPDGIALAPHYDMLSTGTYLTKAFADERATWPGVDLAIPLEGARKFGEVTRESVLAAAVTLGLTRAIGARFLDRMAAALPRALAAIEARLLEENTRLPAAAAPFLAGEMRVVRTIRHVTVPAMLERVAAPG
jgi:serine/threonine-protein kinase HipA